MKKRIVLTIGFLLLAVVIFAQDTINVIHNDGESIFEFLKGNWKGLSLLILLFVSEWMGETDKIPEGSVWRKIVNWALALLKKKNLYQSKKAKFQNATKILLIGIMLSCLGLTANAQAQHPFRVYPFKAKPVELSSDLLKTQTSTDSTLFLGATVAFDVFTKEMKTGDYSVGAIPGVGYGLKWNPVWNPFPTQSFLSLDFFLQAAMDDSDEAKYFNIKLLPSIGFIDWFHIGYGLLYGVGLNDTQDYKSGVFIFSITTTL